MSEIIADLKELRSRLETTQNDLELCREDYQRSETQCEAYKTQIAKLSDENTQLQQIISSRQRSFHEQLDLRSVLHKTQDEKSQLVDRISHIAQDAARKRQEYNQRISTLQQMVSDQELQLTSLQGDLDQSHHQLKCLQQEKDELEAALKKERCDRAMASQQRSTQGDSNDMMKTRFVKMKQELMKTQRELELLKRKV